MALHDFKSQRLFLEHGLASGAKIEASREQANYLLNVLRVQDGASLLVFNGTDGEWRVTLHVIGRKKCRLIVDEQVRLQPERTNLTYCFAPLKQARLDYMIQKAVEMGVGRLQPVITQHTQVRSINSKRIAANAIEAAEQCGILAIPTIEPPLPLLDLPKHLGSQYQLIICDEDAYDASLDLNVDREVDNIALLIGPEGGFSETERQFLHTQKNITLLGLGPRILRADTAAVAALAIIQSKFGDWYTGNDRQQ